MKKNPADDLVTRSRRRAVQYQHVDGTYELLFGGAFLLMAAAYFLISKIGIASDLLDFAPLVMFVAGAYLMDALVSRFRARVTYPRTGYIAYQKPRPLTRPARLAIWIGVPLLTALLLAFMLINRPLFQPIDPLDMPAMTLLFGLLFAGLWVIIAWKTATPRFYLLAVIPILVSLWLVLNGVGVRSSMMALFGTMGLALCVSGGLALLQYLRKNPASQELVDEQ